MLIRDPDDMLLWLLLLWLWLAGEEVPLLRGESAHNGVVADADADAVVDEDADDDVVDVVLTDFSLSLKLRLVLVHVLGGPRANNIPVDDDTQTTYCTWTCKNFVAVAVVVVVVVVVVVLVLGVRQRED
jgi:hypothetical protein